MITKLIKKSGKPNRILRFGYCPQCGQKGLYHVPRMYSRCRYCGLYRMLLPGQDF